jgi:hypothetical protein
MGDKQSLTRKACHIPRLRKKILSALPVSQIYTAKVLRKYTAKHLFGTKGKRHVI